jgi:hypothetical protein
MRTLFLICLFLIGIQLHSFGQEIFIKTGINSTSYDFRSGDGAKLLTTSLNDAIITTAKLANNMGRKVATTLTPAGTTETVNWDNGNVQKLDLGSASGNGFFYLIR